MTEMRGVPDCPPEIRRDSRRCERKLSFHRIDRSAVQRAAKNLLCLKPRRFYSLPLNNKPSAECAGDKHHAAKNLMKKQALTAYRRFLKATGTWGGKSIYSQHVKDPGMSAIIKRNRDTWNQMPQWVPPDLKKIQFSVMASTLI